MKKIKKKKPNRIFTRLRKYGWIFTVLIAIGGLWFPKLGLLVILIMLGLFITSFFLGRYWCGNICPHGSLFDSVLYQISANKKIPKFLKSWWFIGAFFIFFMFNFSRRIFIAFTHWGKLDFLDRLGMVFVMTYLVVMIVGSLLAIFVNPRVWCQFCPMGTFQKASFKMSSSFKIAKKTNKLVTISNIDDCIKCGKCEKVCPFELSPYKNFNEKGQFDNINCIKCKTCIVHCPKKILSLKK